MRPMLKTEATLLLACLGMLALALFGPAVSQPAHYHDFADQRVRWGLPFAMDVLSNLPFDLLTYAAAKLLEVNDHLVYELTGQLVSGHTVKHLTAAMAAAPVIAAIGALRQAGQNAPGRTGTTKRSAPSRVGNA